MNAWWQALEARERRTLAIGAVIAGLIFFYTLVWLPPQRDAAELRERIADARTDLAWMQQASTEVRALRERQPATDTPRSDRALYAVADQSARESGLGGALERVEPSGDRRVRVTLRGAGFDATVEWLDRLRRDHGLGVETATIRRTEDDGQIDAQLVLESAGAAE